MALTPDSRDDGKSWHAKARLAVRAVGVVALTVLAIALGGLLRFALDDSPEPEASDPSTCRDLEGEKQAERKELTAWVRDARVYQKDFDELKEEVRSNPEDRSNIEPDLRSFRRDVQDAQREVRSIRQVLEDLDDEEREEGCDR